LDYFCYIIYLLLRAQKTKGVLAFILKYTHCKTPKNYNNIEVVLHKMS